MTFPHFKAKNDAAPVDIINKTTFRVTLGDLYRRYRGVEHAALSDAINIVLNSHNLEEAYELLVERAREIENPYGKRKG